MSVRILISTVSNEFAEYRDVLRADLTRHNVEVKVQEDFKDLGGSTLGMLDTYIAHCDAVVHLVGDMTGASPPEHDIRALLVRRQELTRRAPQLVAALNEGAAVTYTQWEAWLALYHDKRLIIATAAAGAPRGPCYAPSDLSRAAQIEHVARLAAAERFSGCTFTNPDNLAKHVSLSGILDLLAKEQTAMPPRYRSVIVWSCAAAAVIGAVVSFQPIAPPWPHGMVWGTMALALLVLAMSAVLPIKQRLQKPTTLPLHLVLPALATLSGAYLAAFSFFVYRIPSGMFAKGFVCTRDAELVYEPFCPWLGVDQLQQAEYVAARLWTEASIMIVQTGLAAVWLLLFAVMSFTIGTIASSLVQVRETESAASQAG